MTQMCFVLFILPVVQVIDDWHDHPGPILTDLWQQRDKPASGDLHMGVQEDQHLSPGLFGPVEAGPDQTLPLRSSDDASLNRKVCDIIIKWFE